MLIIDQWAERHIEEALHDGAFDNLPGHGEPLKLDDDSYIPVELRSGYRLLKNAGCLPPELEMRNEALELQDLLHSIHEQHPDYQTLKKRLILLELRLRQSGLSTDFLYGEYADRLFYRLDEE